MEWNWFSVLTLKLRKKEADRACCGKILLYYTPVKNVNTVSQYLSNTPSGSRRQSIQPSSQPVSSLAKLQFNIRHRPRVISAVQLHARLILLKHILTIQRIGVLRPLERAIARGLDVRAADPIRLLTRKLAIVNLRNQRVRKRGQSSRAVLPAGKFLHHLRVPAGVKICSLAVPGDRDIIAAYQFGFIVEGLRDVAEEVDEEFHGLLPVCG